MSIAIVLALQVALAGLPQDLAEGCNDKEGTVALSSCYSEHANHWAERLNAAYPAALQHVKAPQRQGLKRAQAAWIEYRDATCDFYNLTPGSIRLIQGAYCVLDLNRRRALELEEFILP